MRRSRAHALDPCALALVLLLPLSLFSLGPTTIAQAATGSGFVYTMTNAAAANGGNEVIAYERGADGTLVAIGTYLTGGAGSGQPRLGSQGSVILTPDGRWLLVANPGSDDVSVFEVARNGTLALTDVEPSRGDLPESITIRGNLIYVLNTGAPNNISGFILGSEGDLSWLRGSVRPLSQEGALPAQVQFSPDGGTLVVTERNTDRIDTFRISRTGRPGGVRPHDGSGIGPFGLAFRSDGTFVVTESFNGLAGQAAASSYSLTGGFRTISETVQNGQSDVCWAVITNDQQVAYIANNGSGTISSYSIAEDGSIALLQPVAATTGGPGGFGTRDLDLTNDGSYLYAIDVGTLTVNAFSVGQNGALTLIAAYPGLPSTFAGMAAS